MMNLEITDSEAQILKDYRDEILKLIHSKIWGTEIISWVSSYQFYFHALCVKYNQDPTKVKIDTNTKRFEPHNND